MSLILFLARRLIGNELKLPTEFIAPLLYIKLPVFFHETTRTLSCFWKCQRQMAAPFAVRSFALLQVTSWSDKRNELFRWLNCWRGSSTTELERNWTHGRMGWNCPLRSIECQPRQNIGFTGAAIFSSFLIVLYYVYILVHWKCNCTLGIYFTRFRVSIYLSYGCF